MFKKIKDIFLAIITAFIIIIICGVIGINYFGSLSGKIRNGEDFCINKEYSIGKMLGGDNLTFFCDNKVRSKCISGINFYKLGVNKDLYLNFTSGVFAGKTKEEINKNGHIYNYKIFNGDYTKENIYYAKNYDDIKRFLKVNYNDCSIKFYSNNDLNLFSNEEKDIFKSLEK